jgi:hypothetical protein
VSPDPKDEGVNDGKVWCAGDMWPDDKKIGELEVEIEALRKERDELKSKIAIYAAQGAAMIASIGLERDDYRDALEYFDKEFIQKYHPGENWFPQALVVSEVLARYPKEKL